MSRFAVTFRDKIKEDLVIVADGYIKSPALYRVDFYSADLDGELSRSYTIYEVESIRALGPNE